VTVEEQGVEEGTVMPLLNAAPIVSRRNLKPHKLLPLEIIFLTEIRIAYLLNDCPIRYINTVVTCKITVKIL
jgi:hypothetical protein